MFAHLTPVEQAKRNMQAIYSRVAQGDTRSPCFGWKILMSTAFR